MDSSFARRLLDILIENSARILVAGFGVNWAESAFFDVIRLLRQEERLKEHFLTRVRAAFATSAPALFGPEDIPIELIELVAHELRWPELQDIAKQRVDDVFNGDAKLAIGDAACRIAEAYKDNWQDREFYEHYRR